MKRLISLLILFLFTFPVRAAVLNIYNWSGYMPDEVLQQFTKETGIQVNYATYDSNETLYAKLKANPNSGYDLVVPSTYLVNRLIKEGMLKKIDKSKLIGFNHLNPLLLNKAYDPGNQYSIPYLWSSTGIILNDIYHPLSSIKGWIDFWKPQYRNQLLLLNDMREVFSIALLVLHYSANDTDPEHIKQAYLKLKTLTPNIKIFNDEGIKSIYIDEDLTIGMCWNGDAYLAHQENSHLQFIYPSEGFVISIDSLVIPSNAKHLASVYQFINFILRPDIAKKISLSTGYASPNNDAVNRMPKQILNNETIYPKAATLRRSVVQTDVGEANSIYEKYWELLKNSG